MENRSWTQGGEGEDGTDGESSLETYTTICKTDSQWDVLCDLGSSHRGPVTTWRGETGEEMGGRLSREGTHRYLEPTHADVQQKPAQYCKAIIIQLKTKCLKKRLQTTTWTTFKNHWKSRFKASSVPLKK